MAIRSKSKRKRGPQTPQKYPIDVGENYQYWGEQPGYVYDPWSDKYIPDPKMQKQYAEQAGVVEKAKKQPSQWEQAAAAVLPGLAQQAGLLGIQKMFPGKPKVIGTYKGVLIYDDGSTKPIGGTAPAKTDLGKGLLAFDDKGGNVDIPFDLNDRTFEAPTDMGVYYGPGFAEGTTPAPIASDVYFEPGGAPDAPWYEDAWDWTADTASDAWDWVGNLFNW